MHTYIRNSRGWFKAYACNQDGSPHGDLVLNKAGALVPKGMVLETVQSEAWPLTEAEKDEIKRKEKRANRRMTVTLTGREIDALIAAAHFCQYEDRSSETLDCAVLELERLFSRFR